MEHKIIIGFISTLMINSVILGCISTTDNSYSYELHFEVKVNVEDNDNNTLILPIPLNENAQPIELINELILMEGDATYVIEVAKYGYAINISYISKFNILGHITFKNKRKNEYLINEMSMCTSSQKEGYVFYNTTKENISSLYFYSYEEYRGVGPTENTKSYHRYEWKIEEYKLHTGWQIVEFITKWIEKN